MAMNEGWSRPAGPPPSFEQRLSTKDCDTAIGELLLRRDVATLFAPGDWDSQWHFGYRATLEFHDGHRADVRVFSAADGWETRLGDGWRDICDDYRLAPGDLAVFTKALQDRTFHVCFRDADSDACLNRLGLGAPPDPPSSPDDFQGSPDYPDPSPVSFVL